MLMYKILYGDIESWDVQQQCFNGADEGCRLPEGAPAGSGRALCQ